MSQLMCVSHTIYALTPNFSSSSLILASSSATAGVLGEAAATLELVPTSSVIHPRDAVATFWMYLKRVPCDDRRGGGDHAFRLASHSSSEIKRSIVLASGRAYMCEQMNGYNSMTCVRGKEGHHKNARESRNNSEVKTVEGGQMKK